MKEKIHIGIAEDHDLLREGLVALLKDYPQIIVDFHVQNGSLLLKSLKKNLPDVVLLDIEMPVMGGGDAFRVIRSEYPNLKVIIITAFYTDDHIVKYVTAGVNAILPKLFRPSQLVSVIEKVYQEGTSHNSYVLNLLTKSLRGKETLDERLNKLEIDIIKLICANKTSKEIAEELGLKSKAIEYHRSLILAKTKLKNTVALIKYALDNGIV